MPSVYYVLLFLLYQAFLSNNLALAFEYGDPTSLEQAHLEILNRARANPTQEAQRLGINLFESVPTNQISANPAQPLSFNKLLLQSAKTHSFDMLRQNYFAHNTPNGQTPFERIRNQNYDYLCASENLALRGLEGIINNIRTSEIMFDDLFIDKSVGNRAHRVTLLNPKMREIGIGISFGTWAENGVKFNTGMLAADFGTRKANLPIILGVVYDDSNQSRFYNAGEGIADVSITLQETAATTKTASAGGYGLEVAGYRDYALTFSHPQYGTVTKMVHVADSNVKVDVLLSEFPKPSSSINYADGGNTQQCATLEQNQLSIPCINADGDAYIVQLDNINSNTTQSPQFGIKSIINKNLSTAVACSSYDPVAATAYLGCVSINKQNYIAQLKLKAAANNPVFELNIFSQFY